MFVNVYLYVFDSPHECVCEYMCECMRECTYEYLILDLTVTVSVCVNDEFMCGCMNEYLIYNLCTVEHTFPYRHLNIRY